MYPTFRAVLLLAPVVPVALVLVILNEGNWVYGVALLVVILALCGCDVLLSLPTRAVKVSCKVPQSLYVGEEDPLTITFTVAPGRFSALAECLVKADSSLHPPSSIFVDLKSGSTTTFDIPLIPLKRGKAAVYCLWYRWTGPFGLVHMQTRHQIGATVSVVPNSRAVKRAAIQLATQNDLMGNKTQSQFGLGSEFTALREYVPGLDSRSIDWNQSARHRKLICAEYELERNHQIILAIDTGRLMAEPVDGISRLDHAINASLLLAYSSLRAGDRVGLYGFDSRIRQLARPLSGVRSFPLLQQASAELEVNHDDTNFTLGLMNLMGELSRRTLIILQTEFVDTVTAEIMIDNIGRLASRHLVIFVTLSDPSVEADIAREPQSTADLTRAVVATDIANDRKVVFEKLKRLGVLCLEAPREQIGIELINQYLKVKRLELI